jgi:hypothetical protein
LGREVLREVAEDPVFKTPIRSVKHKEAGTVTGMGRVLSDQFWGKSVIELRELHEHDGIRPYSPYLVSTDTPE